MSTSSGELARHWFEEVWNRKRAAAVDELLAPDCSGFMQGVGHARAPASSGREWARSFRRFPTCTSRSTT